MLLVDSGGKDATESWRDAFATLLPDLPVRYLDDPAVPVEDVSYVFVWRPAPGRLAALPNLRLILSSGAGVDGILSDPHLPAHLPIVRMAGDETVQRMTEYVCMGALCLLRDMPRIVAAQHARRWDKFDPDRTARDTRAGVMGLGNLGAAAAQALAGLGFQVSGWSRTAKDIPGVRCFTDLDAFLAQTDILVCLLPDTPGTRGIVNARTLARLQPGAKLLNAARGTHVVVPDLLAALDSGHLDSAMLDVFSPEPLPPESPVWTHPRIIVTPHTASLASIRSRARYVAEAITAFEQGRPLPNLFDGARGY